MTVIIDTPEFGHYDVLARIGEAPRGSLSVACAGEASESLYLLEDSVFATGEDEPQRAFIHDLEHASRIQHRNLVGIVELGATGTGHYVVMPYLEAATFTELQERHRAIRPPRLVLAMVIDALHGLHAAHSFRADSIAQPLVHGSLSPEHLWVGLDGVCRIRGFGHAQPPAPTKSPLRSTAPGYRAPEQLTGGAIDRRTDLFSIGVVLWNALTGKKLFHDRVEHMTMSNVFDRKIPRPSTLGLSPPPVLDAIVMKALERDPQRRFQDAAEMAGALRDVARGAACLASGTEVAEWVAQTFGAELTARRAALHELAAQPRPRRGSRAEIAMLPRLVAPTAAEIAARDYLSLDELARANQLRSSSPRASSLAGPVAEPRTRQRHAIVAGLVFAAVAGVLGWRWSVASVPAAPGPPADLVPPPAVATPGLEVRVLTVRTAAPAVPVPAAATIIRTSEAVPAPEPAPPAIAPLPPGAKPAITAPPPPGAKPAITAPPPPATKPAITAPPRPPPQPIRRPVRAAAPAASTEPPVDLPEARAVESHPDASSPRPESAPRPPLESNPYLYNK
jgi:serine/threonine-protein kinase